MISSRTIRSMRSEWTKIAEPKESKEEAKARNKKLLYGALGTVLGSNVAGAVTMGLAHHSKNLPDDVALTKKLRSASEVPIKDVPGFNGYFAEKDWIPGKDTHIGIGDQIEHSPAILAHEMGHHQISKNQLGRLLQNKLTIMLGSGAPLVGAATGALSGLSDNERVQQLGRWAPLLTSAPQLLYEGGASLSGLHRLHQAGASGKQMLRAAGTLLPAWGTYLGNAGLGVLAAHGTQGVVKHYREKKNEEDHG